MIEHADLACERCQQVTLHELHYAGRILEATRCGRCGNHLEMSTSALLPAYVHDLEQRVSSKPRRMWDRAHRDRGAYLRGLPLAILRQPIKFVREFWSLVRR